MTGWKILKKKRTSYNALDDSSEKKKRNKNENETM